MATFEVEIPRPTIDLLPGIYPAGTIMSYWDNTITKEVAQSMMIKSWSELINDGTFSIGDRNTLVENIDEDENYDLVLHTDVLNMPYDNCRFDTVAGHLNYVSQYGGSGYGINYLPKRFILDAENVRTGTEGHSTTAFYLGKNVKTVSMSIYGTQIGMHLNVHPDNPYIDEIDGNIYSEDGTILYLVPTKVGEFEIPYGVTTLESGALTCSYLSKLYIPSSVIKIDSPFYNYDYGGFRKTYISEIYYDGTMADFFNMELANLEGVGEDVIVYSADNYVFDKSQTEFEITVVNGEICITGYAYKNYLTSLEIPETLFGLPVTSIAEGAFSGCQRLETVSLPEGLCYINPFAFYNCDELKSVEIPDSVSMIGEYAFSGCENLETAVIGNGVTAMGPLVFFECNRDLQIYCKLNSIVDSWPYGWNVSHTEGMEINGMYDTYNIYYDVIWGYTG
jgi:hypothetical protein